MQKQLSLKLKPQEAASSSAIIKLAAAEMGVPASQITGFQKIRQSLDARSKQIWFLLTVNVFVNEPFHERPLQSLEFPKLSPQAKRVIVVGAGPAGLFAALKLLEKGIKPIVIERGKEVRARRRDLAQLNKEGIVNPDSNYCFGEGGAGTYSDGKLYTRSSKRGDINRILSILVQYGADPRILYEAHPHIGTNKLPHIITTIREAIIQNGGEVHFNTKLSHFNLSNSLITGIETNNGTIDGEAVILATGHSARDVFELLAKQNIAIEAKPFALGVRIEHPQELIDQVQYHCLSRGEYLPPASYSLVEQVNGRGVFSFCMCPGGIIAAAATAPNEIVVNGWSPSKRNNPFANSGMVAAVNAPDYEHLVKKFGPLAALQFQKEVEQKAFQYGGGNLVAPALRMVDFSENKLSTTLPECSYHPGVKSAPLKEVLPPFVAQALGEGFKAFGRKMRGYYTNEAIVVATESRTSSPVRIPRDPNSLQHPQIPNLFPCGEGAGYAGGIVSAAMDGERVAEAISN